MRIIQQIKDCIEEFAPKETAADWDNTGILVDCFLSSLQDEYCSILLTIDLTPSVVDECIRKKISNIVCYHPFIFHPIKSVTNPSIVKCIQNNISVYSPHTQLDPLISKYILEEISKKDLSLANIISTLKNLIKKDHIRVVRGIKSSNIPLDQIVYRIDQINIGPGAAYRNVHFLDCLLITGEMSHHDLLKCKFNNVDVILLEHSNSERIFLERLKALISDRLPHFKISISEEDHDPVQII